MILLLCSPEDTAADAIRPLLSDARRAALERRKPPAAARSFLAAEWLLACGLAHVYGVRYADVRFSYAPSGKPFFVSHPQIHFNLSHSGDRVACALSDRPVGVDVQQIRKNAMRAFRYVCDAREWEWVCARRDPADAGTRLWCLKEAYGKWSGSGIAAMREVHFRPADFRGDSPAGSGVSFADGDYWVGAFCGRGDRLREVLRPPFPADALF